MKTKLTVGSLFAGIGGIDLGLERTGGFETKWQVEIDEYALKVLAKHWPDVRRWNDVKTFPPEPIKLWSCDLICGGFPCQDISYAGKGAGLAGERSGLWYEFARVVRILRPRFVLVENVAALLVRGLDRVLGTLASLGYDAEWACIPAAAVGAPHIRDRVFILAHAENYRAGRGQQQPESVQETDVPDALRPICEPGTGGRGVRQGDSAVAHAKQHGLQGSLATDGTPATVRRRLAQPGCAGDVPHAIGEGLEGRPVFRGNTREELAAVKRSNREPSGQWFSEPDVGRVADGVPARVDRLRCLGNAVVPQVAEYIGNRILESIK